jgi:hypothetical protein
MHKFVGMRCSILHHKTSLFCLTALYLLFILHQSQSLHSTVKCMKTNGFFPVPSLQYTLLFTQLIRPSCFFNLNHPSNYYAYKNQHSRLIFYIKLWFFDISIQFIKHQSCIQVWVKKANKYLRTK